MAGRRASVNGSYRVPQTTELRRLPELPAAGDLAALTGRCAEGSSAVLTLNAAVERKSAQAHAEQLPRLMTHRHCSHCGLLDV